MCPRAIPLLLGLDLLDASIWPARGRLPPLSQATLRVCLLAGLRTELLPAILDVKRRSAVSAGPPIEGPVPGAHRGPDRNVGQQCGGPNLRVIEVARQLESRFAQPRSQPPLRAQR